MTQINKKGIEISSLIRTILCRVGHHKWSEVSSERKSMWLVITDQCEGCPKKRVRYVKMGFWTFAAAEIVEFAKKRLDRAEAKGSLR